MQFLWDGFKQAIDLLVHGDPLVYDVLWFTLKVAALSTAFALIIGAPIGLAIGIGRFRGRHLALATANAGLGLPPVVVGLVVALFLFRGAPLGGLHWIYTPQGVVLAQTLLALPIIAAFTAAAAQGVAPGLLDQARALGASRLQVAWLAFREARIGVMAAAIAAVGSALSEVGAIILVGGNIQGQTQTLASAVLVRVSAGDYGTAIAYGLILLGLIFVLTAALTAAQQRDLPWLLSRAS